MIFVCWTFSWQPVIVAQTEVCVLQIIGTKSCIGTKKALRFCKERSIPHQFVDLHRRALSEGEWEKVFRSLEASTLIDEASQWYRKEGYAWRTFDAREELQAHPELLRTPLLKYAHMVVAGFDEQFILDHRGQR